MIERARDAGVESVVAHTLAEVNASTAVLERCGFVHVDTTADPDGDVTEDVYRWELLLTSSEPGGGAERSSSGATVATEPRHSRGAARSSVARTRDYSPTVLTEAGRCPPVRAK